MYDVGIRSAALESTDVTDVRPRMRGTAASRPCSQSHWTIQPTLPNRFEKNLTGQRRSTEISGLEVSRADNVAGTFLSLQFATQFTFREKVGFMARIISCRPTPPSQHRAEALRFISAVFPGGRP